MSEVMRKGKIAKAVSYDMMQVPTDEKNRALELIARQLEAERDFLIKENQKDIEAGKKAGMTDSILDRMLLTEKRIDDMALA
ncbi:gamma-glutamyl-phosphate reductase, partial [Mycobacterium tuberculosis]|nr:gamma-glutamyl-phosphate reductase [Mycobacterium tuberculosis]